jgi:hypothetical protein
VFVASIDSCPHRTDLRDFVGAKPGADIIGHAQDSVGCLMGNVCGTHAEATRSGDRLSRLVVYIPANVPSTWLASGSSARTARIFQSVSPPSIMARAPKTFTPNTWPDCKQGPEIIHY